MLTPRAIIFASLLAAALVGCGEIPLLSANREGFPPWEKLPEGNGLHYVGKFTEDSGIDPLYLAKFEYADEDVLATVVATFGLVPHDVGSEVETFTNTIRDPPPWFPLPNPTRIYVYPAGTQEYVATLWVDTERKEGILERAWW